MLNLFKRKKEQSTEQFNIIIQRTTDQMLMEYLIAHSNANVELKSKDSRKYSDLEIYTVRGECYKSQEIDDGNNFEYSVFHYHDGIVETIYNEKGFYNRFSLSKRNQAKELFTEFVKSLRLIAV